MKIIYTITGLTLGGAETITVNLATRMHELGHTVKLMFLSGEQCIQVPQEIESINLCMKKNPIGFIKAIKKAKKIVKDFQPDVVHANMFHAIVFARALRLFVKVPRLICTEHSNNFHGRIRQIIEHCTDFLSDVNTNVSKNATEYFVKKGLFSEAKAMTVYNGIDLQRFSKHANKRIRDELNIEKSTFVFLNVSRLNPAKDHKTLIQAFSLVHKEQPDTKLICVGDGDLLPMLKTFAEERDVSDSVIFTGAKTTVEDYYNASNCFVLSSAYEGFGLVLAEAMACELPVISTDCGGTREILQDDRWLVSIRNPEELSQKMLEIMHLSFEERKHIILKNLQKVKKFDLEAITQQWLSIYKNQRSGAYEK